MILEGQWKLPDRDIEQEEILSEKLGLDASLTQVLINRGLSSTEEVLSFLKIDLTDLHSPFLISGMEKVVARITTAIHNQEQITIYGDYDVDGIVSTALLLNYFKELDLKVDYYIPDRLQEGYGLNCDAIEKLAKSGTELLITVDCGISDRQELELAQQLGLEVIITDHHEVPEPLVPAFAFLNPKYSACTYPFTELCGAGVVFKLLHALAIKDEKQELIKDYLDLVTLAIVADIVPLVDENRIIVNYGLEDLQNPSNLGIRALVQLCDLSKTEINTGHIGYILAPPLNAAGRVARPELALELLITDSESRALELATELKELNDHRQDVQAQILSAAEAMVANIDLEQTEIIVLAARGWHSGIVGIVASKIVEKYYRPTIMIAIDEDGLGKGSARSIKGFNIYQAIKNSEELFVNYGGHEQAAGLSIEVEKIAQFRTEISRYAKRYLRARELVPTLKLDALVELNDLSLELVAELDRLAPFGLGNPRPKLLLSGVKMDKFKLVGKNNKHLQLVVKDQLGNKVDCIAFEKAYFQEALLANQGNLELAFTLKLNHWQGRTKLQLNLIDIKFSDLSVVDKLFLEATDNYTTQNAKNYFQSKLVKVNLENCSELELGQRLNLVRVSDDRSSDSTVKVESLTGAELGYLNAELADYLDSYLSTGFKYSVLLSGLNREQEQFRIFIQRQKPQIEIETQDLKIEGSDLIADFKKVNNYLFNSASFELGMELEDLFNNLIQGENTLLSTGISSSCLGICQSYAVLKTLNTGQTAIIILPFSAGVEEEFDFLYSKLAACGLEIRQGHANLNLGQKKELLDSFAQGKIDLLLITFEFWQYYQQTLIQFKEQLALIILETNSHLISNQKQELRALAQELNKQQLIVLLKAADTQLITELKNNLKIEQLIGPLLAEKSYQLCEQAKFENKEQRLKELVLANEKSIIYVNGVQESIKLAQYLREQLPELAQGIAFYNQQLSRSRQLTVKKLWQAGQLRAVVSNIAFNQDLLLINIKNIIFYKPVFNLFQFGKLLEGWGSRDAQIQIYLLFNKKDMETNQSLLFQLTPDREFLVKLYRILKKVEEQKGVIDLNTEQLALKMQNLVQDRVSERSVEVALKIFAELGLLFKINEVQQALIQLEATPEQKLELTDSLKYKENLQLRKSFEQFKELINKGQIKKLLI